MLTGANPLLEPSSRPLIQMTDERMPTHPGFAPGTKLQWMGERASCLAPTGIPSPGRVLRGLPSN